MPKRKPDRCERWPECVCKQHWDFYATAPAEYFTEAQPIIEAMLACVGERCPDGRYRAHATVQLLKIQSSPNLQKEKSA